jgi:hypothetical protein
MGRGSNNLLYGQLSEGDQLDQIELYSNSLKDYSTLIQQVLNPDNCSPKSITLNQDIVNYVKDKFADDPDYFEAEKAREIWNDDRDIAFSGSLFWFVRKQYLPELIDNTDYSNNSYLTHLKDEFQCFADYHSLTNDTITKTELVSQQFFKNTKFPDYHYHLTVDWDYKPAIGLQINLLDFLGVEKVTNSQKGRWFYSEGDSIGTGNHYFIYVVDHQIHAAIKADDPID